MIRLAPIFVFVGAKKVHMPAVGSHYAPYHAPQHGRRRIAQQIQATPRSPKMVQREKPITPLTTAAQRSRKAPPRETPSNAATMPLVSRRIIPIRRETWPGPLAHAARADRGAGRSEGAPRLDLDAEHRHHRCSRFSRSHSENERRATALGLDSAWVASPR